MFEKRGREEKKRHNKELQSEGDCKAAQCLAASCELNYLFPSVLAQLSSIAPSLTLKIIFMHRGMTPAAADLNLLETARRCELYGIKMHPAKVSKFAYIKKIKEGKYTFQSPTSALYIDK